jgi:hypothetical protein
MNQIFLTIKRLTISLILTYCYLLTGCSGESGNKTMDFLTIADHNDMGTLYGDQINYNRLHQVVIKNPANWTQFWNQYTEGKTPVPEKPVVNFDQHMVIGIFMELSTPCTSLKINKVSEDSKVTVHYQITSSSGICVQVTADKGEIISIAKTDKEIIFHEIID